MTRLSGKVIAVCATGLFLISAAIGQEQSQKTPIKSPTLSRYVRCGALVQPETGKVQRNVLITIEGERIQQVQENAQPPADAQVIDLSDHTCLPGLIDTHTHTLLQGDITAADYDEQLLKQSTAYRAILGTRSVRRALDYGFTTIRDLETEGAGYADVDLKKAINNGIIPGPRMNVATRAMDVTGAYPLLGYSPDITVPHGVQVVDGADRWLAKRYVSRSALAPTGSRYIPTAVILSVRTESWMTFQLLRSTNCAPSWTKRIASTIKWRRTPWRSMAFITRLKQE